MKCINCMRFSIFRIRLSFNFTMFTNVCEYPLSYSTYIFSKGQYQPLWSGCFCIHIWPKILNVKFSIQEQEPEHGNSDLPRASTLPVLLQKPHPNCPPTVIALQELYALVTSHFHQLSHMTSSSHHSWPQPNFLMTACHLVPQANFFHDVMITSSKLQEEATVMLQMIASLFFFFSSFCNMRSSAYQKAWSPTENLQRNYCNMSNQDARSAEKIRSGYMYSTSYIYIYIYV